MEDVGFRVQGLRSTVTMGAGLCYKRVARIGTSSCIKNRTAVGGRWVQATSSRYQSKASKLCKTVSSGFAIQGMGIGHRISSLHRVKRLEMRVYPELEKSKTKPSEASHCQNIRNFQGVPSRYMQM